MKNNVHLLTIYVDPPRRGIQPQPQSTARLSGSLTCHQRRLEN